MQLIQPQPTFNKNDFYAKENRLFDGYKRIYRIAVEEGIAGLIVQTVSEFQDYMTATADCNLTYEEAVEELEYNHHKRYNSQF